ncbi:MAG: hypothetical protein VYA84_13855 [Planctomycetota bacterium]|nr:hypothetical protein [Planctomycetota bacterium]
MYLLPCPHCEHEIPVANYQAGDETACSQCGQSVAIPKLGQLRQLPAAESPTQPESVGKPGDGEFSPLRRGGFLLFGLIAVASFLIAAFCGINWFLSETSGSTAEHLKSVRTEYAKVTAAQLIREFEDMDNLSLDLTLPYTYKTKENRRREWGQNATVAASVGSLSVLASLLLIMLGRRKQTA